MAEDATAHHRRPGDPLPPGRGNTDFMASVVTGRWRGSRIWPFSLVGVGVFILAEFLDEYPVYRHGNSLRLTVGELAVLKNKKGYIRKKYIICITKIKIPPKYKKLY